ncbi:MAG TPA: zinc-binding dehydrogenase [Tepidisphaeraceae bacterium]|jgi:2-desacetyl-2-hydroxyethyl bacteriochlorophyllide A dehydrogenase
MATQLIFTAPKKVGYIDLPLADPRPGEVVAKTIISGISHGTEMTGFMGTSPFITKTMTPQRTFRDKKPGDGEFYPFHHAGYDAVGIVEKVGEGVSNYRAGDRVWYGANHQTGFVFRADAADALKLPAAIPDEEAIMTNLAVVALTAVHDAEILLGGVVAVSGGGTVGQLAAQLVFLNGARRVFFIEPNKDRRAFAAARSAVEPIDPTAGSAALQIFDRNGGLPPDVVIECSGHVAGLAGAVAAAGIAGTVIAAGFYAGSAAALCFGEEFLHNRVTLKASMGVWDCPDRHPERWNRPRMLRVAHHLMEQRQLRLDGFVSGKFPFTEGQRAYEAIEKEPGRYLKAAFVYQ